MINVSIRRTTLLLLVVVVFVTTPWASAASPRPEGPRWAQGLDDVPFLGNFWIFLRSAWEKEGCNIDPNGHCIQEPTPSTKIGCHLDPWGHCVNEPTQPPPLQPKAGCHIDPNGHCIP